tara:strand:+ start:1508 stop:1672 length:165 start_codon:yes stop_codon:yes gene_type:complete
MFRLATTITDTGVRWATSNGDRGFEPCERGEVAEVIDRLILDFGPDQVDIDLGD